MSNLSTVLPAAFLVIAVLISAPDAYGQNSSTGGQRFSSGINATGAGQLGRSTSDLVGGNSAQGGPGQGTNGQNGIGQQGFGQPGQGGPLQNQGFIGRDADAARNALDQMGGRERRSFMFDMMIENLNEMREQRRRFEAQNRDPSPARVLLTPAFTKPAIVTSGAPTSAVQARLNQTFVLPDRFGAVRPAVSMTGRTAVVSGTVESEHQRKLVERLIMMQPGVSKVDNQLTVADVDQAPAE